MKQAIKRFLACALAVVMVLGMVPASMFAVSASAAENSLETDLGSLGMTVVTDDQSTLAPGVTLNEVVLFDKKGNRVEMYVTISDPSVETVKFYANYKDNQCAQWGMQTLSEQVAAIEANYEEPFKVVAGLNASYYNTTNGAPTGAFVMEGIDVSTSGNNYPFFAVLKDGTVMIGHAGQYNTYKSQIKEAIGGYIHLVKEGAICSGLNTVDKYPRQTIGITADGKVITMTADGSQTKTVGLTIYEQAEVMLALGCVEALHLDGGNSATFGTIPEGSDKFVTTNSPSGGAERAVSNTLMIVSTAVADGTFDHAVITSDYEYFVSNSSYTFSAFGVDATNAAAEIPETVIWTLSDDSFGTIENGTFVSNGKLGTVDIQMSNEGKIVGSKTIEVVTPSALRFPVAETTVPYGKSSELTITAMYGNNEAFCTADAFNFTVDPAAAGTMNGFQFTAANDESITSAVVTAAYKYDATVASTSITVKFGKGSEVLFDFENGDVSDWHGTDTIGAWIDEQNAAGNTGIFKPEDYYNGISTNYSSVFLASEENGGKVKSGNYALGLRLNHLYADGIGSWMYNYLYYTGETKVLRDLANGKTSVRLGMWVYSPNITNVAFRLARCLEASDGSISLSHKYMLSDYDGKPVSYSTNYGIPEAGWIYVYYNLTDKDDRQTTTLYSSAANNKYTYPTFVQFFTGDATDTMNDMIFYIDDITLDFSEVTDDRDAPSITDISVCSDTANFVAMNGQTVTSNLLSFSAAVSDNSGNANATGLDYTTAKIYIDGIDVSGNASFKAANGTMTLNDVYLTDGQHSISFVIFDKQGNETRVTKTLTVAGTAGNAVVTITGHNEGNHTPKAGSVYYIDVKASDAAQIEKIITTLKLNSANRFEYENIICAEGVTATAEYDALDFEVTVTLTHDGSLSGEAVLASIPVRVWAWSEEATGKTSAAQFASGAIPVIDIECKVLKGDITYAGTDFDSYITGFSGALDVATELDNETAWHAHTVEAVADKAATCTETGYIGRTYCADCASVIDWGTTVEMLDHTYAITDGVLKCQCGLTFTGVYTDGKTYVDGIVAADGWNGNSYYTDGMLLTGVQKVMAPDASGEFYYDFGTDGVCANQIKYTGMFQNAEDGKYYYAKLGVLTGDWQMVENNWHYFDPTDMAAVSGHVKVEGVYFDFEENGKLVSGVWVNVFNGYRYYYGPGYHIFKWQQIDGQWYYFKDGLRLTGYQKVVTFQTMAGWTWYQFDDNGVMIDIADGLCDVDGKLHYIVNGKEQRGLQLIDGAYYHTDYYGAIESGSIYIGENAYGLEKGYYYFGEDGKMMGTSESGEIIEIDGVRYYYVDGRPAAAGLININGDLYFAGNGGKLATGSTYVWITNGIMAENTYYFDAEGKMVGTGDDGAIVEIDGVRYYYKNGRGTAAGLILRDGSYYFADIDGKLSVGEAYVWNANGLMNEDTYYFDANGAMLGIQMVDGETVSGQIVDENGTLRYYKNGKPTPAGIFEMDGHYYFAGNGGVIATGAQYVWQGNGYFAEDDYYFDADGKMVGVSIVDGEKVLGQIAEIDGILYYFENGKKSVEGLFKMNGNFYFAGLEGKLAVGECYVWNANGLMKENTYYFAEDGRLIGLKEVEEETVSGEIITVDGKQYYYANGKPEPAGLIVHDGSYYFAGVGGEIATGMAYVWRTNDLLNEDNYYFGEDGKMLGIEVVGGEVVSGDVVEIDGSYFYYETGKPSPAGLVVVDGNYYFADVGGAIGVGEVYVWRGNGLLREDSYYFDAEGKMLGIKVVDGETIHGEIVDLCYYKDGKPVPAGLIEYEGYYCFADVGGKIATGEKYVWQSNGLLAQDTYIFDADGKMLGIKVVDGEIISGEIVETADGIFYYKNGKANAAGLVVVDGYYYFAGVGGQVAVGETYVWKTNDLLSMNNYIFDDSGKMLGIKVVDGAVVSGEILEYQGELHYFRNGKGHNVGLLYIDGYYYFANTNGKLVVSQDFYVWEGNGLLLEQVYTFDANGRIIK